MLIWWLSNKCLTVLVKLLVITTKTTTNDFDLITLTRNMTNDGDQNITKSREFDIETNSISLEPNTLRQGNKL